MRQSVLSHDKLENTPLTPLRVVHNHNLYIRIHILRPDLENQFSENNRMFVILQICAIFA